MNQQTVSDLTGLVAELRDEIRRLGERVARLEGTASAPAAVVAPVAAPVAPAAPAPVARQPEVTEEELLAISAAIAAFLGVRARIRQIRLIQSSAWAQVGRVTVQASHRLH